MLKKIILINVLAIMLLSVAAAAQTAQKEKSALVAAEKWVALLGNRDYQASWKEASKLLEPSELLKVAVPEKEWKERVRTVQNSLGNVISRRLLSVSIAAKVPDMTDGEFAIIRYRTSYQNTKSVVETVIAELDRDGQWRIVSFLITPHMPGMWSIVMAAALLIVIIVVWIIELKSNRELFGRSPQRTS